MNPSSDIAPTSPGEAASAEPRPQPAPPLNWREALAGLVAARMALIQLESKDAARDAARRAAWVAAACGCAFFAWALLLAGVIPMISESLDWPWNRVAVGAAILHLLAGIILVRLAKPSAATAFPVTRAEFQKDREWIENFPKTKKSNG